MSDSTPERSAELWAAYAADRSRENRDALIVNYLSLVRYVASKLGQGLPQSVEQADLASYGTFGLIDAIERFEPERGFKFETFAISRIRGAMLDELRGMDWVPRSMRAKARLVDKAQQDLEGELRRSATSREVAESLDMSEDQYQATLGQVSLSTLVGLDETLSNSESLTVGDTLHQVRDDGEVFWEMQEVLAGAIEEMPMRERVVITLYYYEGLTLAEIGTVLGVTESRVCQIHTKAMEGLQADLHQLAP